MKVKEINKGARENNFSTINASRGVTVYSRNMEKTIDYFKTKIKEKKELLLLKGDCNGK